MAGGNAEHLLRAIPFDDATEYTAKRNWIVEGLAAIARGDDAPTSPVQSPTQHTVHEQAPAARYHDHVARPVEASTTHRNSTAIFD